MPDYDSRSEEGREPADDATAARENLLDGIDEATAALDYAARLLRSSRAEEGSLERTIAKGELAKAARLATVLGEAL